MLNFVECISLEHKIDSPDPLVDLGSFSWKTYFSAHFW